MFSLLYKIVSDLDITLPLRNAHHVWLTQMTWSTSLKVNFNNLFVRILAASAKPNNEWSVNTVRRPMVLAWSIASWHMLLRLA